MVKYTNLINEEYDDQEYYQEETETETEKEIIEEKQEKIDTIILNIKSELIAYSQTNTLPLCEYLDDDVIETFLYHILT